MVEKEGLAMSAVGHRGGWPDGGYWVHIWAANGYDDWDVAGWACDEEGRRHPGREEASGVGLPVHVMDEFVMMRLAEMIHEGLVDQAIDRAQKTGGRLLEKDAERLKAALHQVQLEDPDPL
jgi:hypothetical protein